MIYSCEKKRRHFYPLSKKKCCRDECRSKIVKSEDYRGRYASKGNYFYGFKVHMTVTSEGIPVEYTFSAGRIHDLDGLKTDAPEADARQ
ncbi:MAG: transposase [Cytophagaceae bacterium]|nr:transposase [Cytophagaceae bacterium]